MCSEIINQEVLLLPSYRFWVFVIKPPGMKRTWAVMPLNLLQDRTLWWDVKAPGDSLAYCLHIPNTYRHFRSVCGVGGWDELLWYADWQEQRDSSLVSPSCESSRHWDWEVSTIWFFNFAVKYFMSLKWRGSCLGIFWRVLVKAAHPHRSFTVLFILIINFFLW